MVKDYYDVRAVFKKTGRAIYISHLDLMRVMQRTFKRAKLPVWFTKGYNPHIYLMFALPLSLGVSSECELMDFRIDISAGAPDYENIKNRLNQVLPTGLEIVKLYEPKTKHTEIGACEYEVNIYSSKSPQEILKLYDEFFAQDGIYIEKRCKINMRKTIVTIDIKPDIMLLDKHAESDCASFSFRLPAGISHSLNIVSLTNAFESFCGFEFDKICIKRTRILSLTGENFT